MAAQEIGVGLIGFGLGGRVFHAPFISAVPGLRLVSILQRTGDQAAKAYPTAKIERALAALLADPSVQVVVVSTPNPTHFDIARQALEAGKHVVVDKPFAATSAEALELGRLARSKGLLAIPFHNRRWDGDFLTVKKLLNEQAVGRLVTFESHFDRFRPVPRANSWKETDSPANGMLFDLGPHLVDQALALFGAPAAITASIRSDRDESAIDDAFDITLHYSSDGHSAHADGRSAPSLTGKGLLVHCRATYLACDPSPRFLLHGTRGSFKKYGVDPQEPALVGGAKVPPLGSSAVWLQEQESAWGKLTVAPVQSDPAMLVERQVMTEVGDYRSFYSNLRDAVLGAAAPAIAAEDGYRVVKLLELARASSARGCTLPVEF